MSPANTPSSTRPSCPSLFSGILSVASLVFSLLSHKASAIAFAPSTPISFQPRLRFISVVFLLRAESLAKELDGGLALRCHGVVVVARDRALDDRRHGRLRNGAGGRWAVGVVDVLVCEGFCCVAMDLCERRTRKAVKTTDTKSREITNASPRCRSTLLFR